MGSQWDFNNYVSISFCPSDCGCSRAHVVLYKILSRVFHSCLCFSMESVFPPAGDIADNLSLSILFKWPNPASLIFSILSNRVSCCHDSFKISSTRILSRLALPAVLLSQFISASIIPSCSFCRHQHSDLQFYASIMEWQNVLCSVVFYSLW